MNNIRLQRGLTSVSLVTQSFGFAILGSLTALRGGSDSEARIGGLLSVLTGTMFLVAAIAYWRTCHRQTGQRLGVPGIQAVVSSALHLPALSGDAFGRPTAKIVGIGKWLVLKERCWQRPRTLSGPFHNAESLRSLSIQDYTLSRWRQLRRFLDYGQMVRGIQKGTYLCNS